MLLVRALVAITAARQPGYSPADGFGPKGPQRYQRKSQKDVMGNDNGAKRRFALEQCTHGHVVPLRGGLKSSDAQTRELR